MTCSNIGSLAMAVSRSAGAIFSPVEVTMMSLSRPLMYTRPFCNRAWSPVCSQPSGSSVTAWLVLESMPADFNRARIQLPLQPGSVHGFPQDRKGPLVDSRHGDENCRSDRNQVLHKERNGTGEGHAGAGRNGQIVANRPF